MNISLLFPFLSFLFTGPQVPNYFRSYPTASTEANKSNKELLIFFTSENCTTCESAWNAYAKDEKAVKRFVSTKVMADDFDGKILFDQFNPGQVPSWMVLGANGEVKEKWQGGWKDASGNPSLFDNTLMVTSPANEKKVASPPTSTSKTQNTTTGNKETVSPAKNVTATPPIPKPVVTATTGYIIQAGYFGSETNAQKCVGDLIAKGFSQYIIQPVDKNGTTFYQVWSSNFSTEAEANSGLQKLTAAGLKGTVKKRE